MSLKCRSTDSFSSVKLVSVLLLFVSFPFTYIGLESGSDVAEGYLLLCTSLPSKRRMNISANCIHSMVCADKVGLSSVYLAITKRTCVVTSSQASSALRLLPPRRTVRFGALAVTCSVARAPIPVSKVTTWSEKRRGLAPRLAGGTTLPPSANVSMAEGVVGMATVVTQENLLCLSLTGIFCPPFDDLPNGNVGCTDGSFYTSLCTFSCDEGYQLIGPPKSRCSMNRTWSTRLQYCERKSWLGQSSASIGISCCLVDFSLTNSFDPVFPLS